METKVEEMQSQKIVDQEANPIIDIAFVAL